MAAEEIARLSNLSVYSAMFVLAIAMVFFAIAFAGRRTADVSVSSGRQRVPVGAGAATSADATLGADDQRGGGGFAEANPAVGPRRSDSLGDAEPSQRWGNIGMSLSWLALLLLAVSIASRGIWAGRAPWGNMYEFSLSMAAAMLAVFLLVSVRRDVRWAGVFVIPVVLLTLGTAVTLLYSESAQLVPALDSYWLPIHVSAAIISGGSFAFAGVASALYLVRERGERRAGGGAVGGVAGRLPAASKLDRLAYRTIAFTMPLWTFAIISGAIWAEYAWGRYWGWDPKETWALITWLVYAGYLHARSTSGWQGRRAAILALLGLLTFVFNYFGVNLFFSGLHSYAGV